MYSMTFVQQEEYWVFTYTWLYKKTVEKGQEYKNTVLGAGVKNDWNVGSKVSISISSIVGL